MSVKIRKTVLKNGLTVVECHYPNFSSVYFDLAFRGGPFYEDRATQGLSHLTEHLISKKIRTEFLGCGWVKNYIEDEFLAYTSADRVNFEFSVHKKDTLNGIKLVEAVFESVTGKNDKKFFEKEREIIAEEVLEEKSDQFFNGLKKIIYGLDQFHFNVLGHRDKIEKFSQKEQADFARKFFCPNNAVLTLAGNIKMSRSMINQLESSPMGKEIISAPFKLKDFKKTGKLFIFDRQCKQNQFLRSRIIKQKTPADNIKWSFFVRDILSLYLFYRLKNRFSTYSFNVDLNFYGRFLLFYIESSFQPHKNLDFFKLLKKEIGSFKKLFTASDLNKIKNNKIKNLEMDAEYPQQFANMIAWYALNYGANNIITIEDQIEIIKKITLKDIGLLFDELFGNNNFITILAGKITEEEKRKIKTMFKAE